MSSKMISSFASLRVKLQLSDVLTLCQDKRSINSPNRRALNCGVTLSVWQGDPCLAPTQGRFERGLNPCGFFLELSSPTLSSLRNDRTVKAQGPDVHLCFSQMKSVISSW